MLAQELHEPVIKKLKKNKLYPRSNDNVWAADFAEMESLSSFNRGVKYLLYTIDVFTEYAWVKLLKDKTAKTVFHDFIEIVNEFKCNPNKLSRKLIKEENFAITLCKNGLIMIF